MMCKREMMDIRIVPHVGSDCRGGWIASTSVVHQPERMSEIVPYVLNIALITTGRTIDRYSHCQNDSHSALISHEPTEWEDPSIGRSHGGSTDTSSGPLAYRIPGDYLRSAQIRRLHTAMGL